MAFKRQEDIPAQFAQLFIDDKLPKCPFCKTDDPYWTIEEKVSFFTSKFSFKCSKCETIISTMVEEALSFTGVNPPKIGTTIFNWTKPRFIFAIESKGNLPSQEDQNYKKAYTVAQLNDLASKEQD